VQIYLAVSLLIFPCCAMSGMYSSSMSVHPAATRAESRESSASHLCFSVDITDRPDATHSVRLGVVRLFRRAGPHPLLPLIRSTSGNANARGRQCDREDARSWRRRHDLLTLTSSRVLARRNSPACGEADDTRGPVPADGLRHGVSSTSRSCAVPTALEMPLQSRREAKTSGQLGSRWVTADV